MFKSGPGTLKENVKVDPASDSYKQDPGTGLWTAAKNYYRVDYCKDLYRAC